MDRGGYYYMLPGDYLNVAEALVSQNGAFSAYVWGPGSNTFNCGWAIAYLNSSWPNPNIWYADGQGSGSAQVQVVFAKGPETGQVGLQLWWSDGQLLWGSGWVQGGICVLGNDGNLAIYSGSDPTNPGNVLWEAGCSQGEGQIQAMTNVVYDTPNAVITPQDNITIDDYICINTSPEELTCSGTLRGTNTVTSTWSVGGFIQVSVETTVEAGIPLVAEGKVTVGVTAQFNWQYDQTYTQSISQSGGYSVKLPPAPPDSCVQVSLTGQQVQVTIPFSAQLVMFFPQSGCTAGPNDASGMYTGGQGTEFEVYSAPYSPCPPD